ncbi:hypothetical protein [Enterococcus sp. AZ109]|uniref:hypothetical protein n=1 Tax=Enterococcus sp. AZ109 TaxID=2774634 RepID=UPI003F297906
MNQKKWEVVRANYSAEKEYIEDGYYRLRPTEEGYQLAFLVPGMCGETLIHPEITIEMIDGVATPIRLIDMESTPTLRLSVKDGDGKEIKQQTEALLNKFIAAKKLVL